MPREITIPRLGWSMEEGIFSEWLKTPGDFVSVGDMVFMLEGEKATQEIESFDSGILCVPDDAPQPGDTVQVGQVIGFLLDEGESAPTSVGQSIRECAPSHLPPASTEPGDVASSPSKIRSVSTAKARAAGPAARRLARQMGIDINRVPTPDPTGRVLTEDVRRAAGGALRVLATPRARLRARELGIAWQQVPGTGRNGRIRERDILAFAQQDSLVKQHARPFEPDPVAPGTYAPASKVRRIIAQRMRAAVQQAAPVTLATKVDATRLCELRERCKRTANGQHIPSVNDCVIVAIAQTLREHPELNACWHREGIYTYGVVNIALAMDTHVGLVAPVVRDADQLTVFEVAEQSARLVARARAGQLTEAELSGGTFTVTNLGMYGVDAFTPILNLPQAAILGVGRIVQEPIVRDDQVIAGRAMTLSLTFDHRVVDGAPAARWLESLGCRLKEMPNLG
ncbi:MAG: 2-oxo acid dehydrogenase subunit E2 [Planctomycetales bacterium]|nr:2-oxo acid dehydrogenase subunit E2 [Planctomycetales bacterium]